MSRRQYEIVQDFTKLFTERLKYLQEVLPMVEPLTPTDEKELRLSMSLLEAMEEELQTRDLSEIATILDIDKLEETWDQRKEEIRIRSTTTDPTFSLIMCEEDEPVDK